MHQRQPQGVGDVLLVDREFDRAFVQREQPPVGLFLGNQDAAGLPREGAAAKFTEAQ